jgi:putative Holliday junction resolvase
MRHLGIDFGTKKVGLALSDEEGAMAFPLRTVAAGPLLVSHIADLVREERVGKIVIGESKDYRGQDNPVMRDIRRFCNEIKNVTGVEVCLEPEMLTSKEAMRLQDTKNSKLDASAAALILQSFLDKRKP